MTKLKIFLFALLLIAGFSLSASAQTETGRADRNDARQAAQRTRIAEGRASGELTRAETVQLRAEQRQIRRVERRAEADGTLTRREAKRINRLQNQASRNIRRQKNDPQDRIQ